MTNYDLWGNLGFTGSVFGETHRGVVKTHDEVDCAGRPCPLHNPSDHSLRDAPLVIRTDYPVPLAERTCEHGIGHPDPDSLNYFLQHEEAVQLLGEDNLRALGTHGCDGCCS